MVFSQEMTALADQLVASDQQRYDNPLPALPYRKPARHIIREHLMYLSNSFSSFEASTCSFIHNNGLSITLIRAEGSICIGKCTLDLAIWLPESYPYAAPLVYLSPPKGMVYVQKQEYVDSTGMVSMPYLTNWESTASNLADLVKQLEMLFSEYHPFCSGPDLKDDLILDIAKSISRDMHDKEMKVKGLMQIQSVLEERNEALTLCLDGLESESDTMKQQLEKVTMNINLMKNWLCENETKAVWSIEDGEIEELFEISDGKDVSDNDIADSAIDDTMYTLDNAVQEECVPFDTYLKSIRVLSREQFFHREAQRIRSLEDLSTRQLSRT